MRINFTKAPLVVLGGVLGALLAVLTAQVLLAEGDSSTVVTQPVRTNQDPAPGEVDGANAGGNDNSASAAQPDQAQGSNPPDSASSSDPSGSPEPSAGAGEGSSAEGTLSRSIDQMNDPAYVTDRLAEGFAHDFEGVIDRAEARCMAEVVVATFGVDRLWQITEAMADANANPGSVDHEDPRPMNDAETDELNAQLRPCVSAEAANRLSLN